MGLGCRGKSRQGHAAGPYWLAGDARPGSGVAGSHYTSTLRNNQKTSIPRGTRGGAALSFLIVQGGERLGWDPGLRKARRYKEPQPLLSLPHFARWPCRIIRVHLHAGAKYSAPAVRRASRLVQCGSSSGDGPVLVLVAQASLRLAIDHETAHTPYPCRTSRPRISATGLLWLGGS